jgi:hypothetical protein
MNRNTFAFILFVIHFTVSLAQTPGFEYRRELPSVQTEDWYAITLPAEIFRRLNPDYSDLRLYQLNDKDTMEIPYLLKVRNDDVSEGVVSLPVLNKSTKDGKLFLTFQLNKNQLANYLDLDFEEKNFNGYAKLEGSNDQKEWFELVSKQRILSIQNPDVDFKALTLNFPVANYKFLRVAITSDKRLTFASATFRSKEVKAGSFNEIQPSMQIVEEKKNKQTVIAIGFRDFQPVSKLSLLIDQPGDYYRSFSMEVLRDSSQAPNQKWMYYYNPVTEGYLTSVEGNTFEFPVVAAKKIRITIFNADNAPLKIKGITAFGPQVQLVAQIKPGNNFLFYGNPVAYTPSYDLVHFENQVPDSLSMIQLEQEEKLTPEKEKISPLLENKLWLWVAMAAVIALLGFGTLRMISKK